jgi:hypothetical protein
MDIDRLMLPILFDVHAKIEGDTPKVMLLESLLHVILDLPNQVLVSNDHLCYQRIRVTGQQPGFRLDKLFSSVPELSKNPMRSMFVGQTRIRTRQPVHVAGLGLTHLFQSPKCVFGSFDSWLHSDILRSCAKYQLWYLIVFVGFIGCHYNQKKERDDPYDVLKSSVNDLLSCIISKI